MAEKIRVLVTGAAGRMGREVVRAVTDAQDMEVAAAVDLGVDLGNALRLQRPKVMVDFTVPEAVMPNIRLALAAKVIPLVGTTGLKTEFLDEITALCAQYKTPALIAPNFALGAVLLMRFAADAAKYFPDVEIIEMHHEKKLDAPSGTAALTAEMIARARVGKPRCEPQGAFESVQGARGGKTEGDVTIHSVRLPGFVASQEVIFGGPGQRLSLRHDSIDRASFMPGVLLAIRKASTMTGLVYGLENLL